MSTKALYKENDNLLELSGLKNKKTGLFINDAVVTVTVFEANGTTETTGQVWPATMSYVAASDGKYDVTLEDTIASNTVAMIAKITAVGEGLTATFKCTLEHTDRGCC